MAEKTVKKKWMKPGKLTAHARQEMPKKDFALPGKGEGPKGAGAGSYPIPDESHARNALARAAQHASPSEKKTIKEKVHKKFPGISIDGGKADKLYGAKRVKRG